MATKELTAKTGWRPAAMWVFVIGSAAWLAICAYLVLFEIATIAEVTAVVMTLIGGQSSMGTAYTIYRSKEKMANKHEDEFE